MKRIALISLLYLFVNNLYAQEGNLQTYTPSILFSKGDFEFKSFQNLYSQNRVFESSASKSAKGDNEVFFSSINQFLYGVNSQINVGFDFWVQHTNRPLSFSPSVGQDFIKNGDRVAQTGITLAGPKIKIAPFKGLKRLSIQSSYLFSTVSDKENKDANSDRPGFFFSTDRSIWLTQFFYDLPVSDKFQLFFQQAFWYSNVRDSFAENNFLETQSSVFFSYFADSRWTIYGMTEYFPTHYDSSFGVQSFDAFNRWFVQSGLGVKYQLIPGLIELETLYTSFWLGSTGAGAGKTFNFGIRLINQK